MRSLEVLSFSVGIDSRSSPRVMLGVPASVGSIKGKRPSAVVATLDLVLVAGALRVTMLTHRDNARDLRLITGHFIQVSTESRCHRGSVLLR
jgi:hypothetical protein